MNINLNTDEIALLIAFCNSQIAKCDIEILQGKTVFERYNKVTKANYEALKKKLTNALEEE